MRLEISKFMSHKDDFYNFVSVKNLIKRKMVLIIIIKNNLDSKVTVGKQPFQLKKHLVATQALGC